MEKFTKGNITKDLYDVMNATANLDGDENVGEFMQQIIINHIRELVDLKELENDDDYEELIKYSVFYLLNSELFNFEMEEDELHKKADEMLPEYSVYLASLDQFINICNASEEDYGYKAELHKTYLEIIFVGFIKFITEFKKTIVPVVC